MDVSNAVSNCADNTFPICPEFAYSSYTLCANRVIHRADYQKVLLQQAQELGAEIQTDAEVVGVNSGYNIEEEKGNHEKVCLILKDGQRVYGDAVIGADGTKVQTAF